jgi:deazaflavin-dependent oxidoreductase (nitroreductase family)
MPRQTVLEVVRYDQESGMWIIASGFGSKSDWVLNIQADPSMTVKSKGVEKKALARRLERQEAGDELVDYNQRHPAAMGALARLMGYRLDGSEEDVRALGELIPMFSLTLLKA